MIKNQNCTLRTSMPITRDVPRLRPFLFLISLLLALAATVSSAKGALVAYHFDVTSWEVGSGSFSVTLDPSASYPEGTVFGLSVNGITSGLYPNFGPETRPPAPGTPWVASLSHLDIYVNHAAPSWSGAFAVYLSSVSEVGGLSNYLPNHSSPWTGLEIIDSVKAAPQVRFAGFTPVPEPSTYIAGALMLLPVGFQCFRYMRNRKQA
jgi:hypothetical protein